MRGVLVFGAVLCASPVSFAQDRETDALDDGSGQPNPGIETDGAKERMRVLLLAGTERYEAGAYEDAIREWRRAYELSERAEIFRSLSLAYEALGRFRRSHDFLQRFLRQVDVIADRADLELRLAILELRMNENGEPDVPPRPRPAPESYVSPGAIVGFVASGVGLITVAVFGGLAVDEDLRLRETCASLCYRGAGDDLRMFAFASDLGLGLTIVGAALGLVFLLADPGPEGSDVVSVAPVLDHVGGGLLVRGRQ